MRYFYERDINLQNKNVSTLIQESNQMKLSVTPTKVICIIAFIGLSALALSGGADNVADENLDGALAATGGIYATARGINALVSVLQGTELDLPFVTLSVGEVLDPVNDLIERFSTVVLFALGAVAAQKVLLVLVSSDIFNYAFTGIAVLAGLGLVTLRASFFTPLLKIFLIVVFVRFALCIVVVCNHWVDSTFLDPIDYERHRSMQEFKGELQTVKDLTTRESDYSQAQSLTLKTIQRLESLLKIGQQKLLKKEQEIVEASSQLDQRLESEDRICRLSVGTPILSPTCSDSIQPYIRNLKKKKQEKTDIEDKIDGFRDELEDEKVNLECLQKRSEGRACSLWDHIPSPPDISVIQNKLSGMDNKLDAFTENAWLLLISILLKSVAIPLLFFYTLLKCTGLIWKSDYEKFIR